MMNTIQAMSSPSNAPKQIFDPNEYNTNNNSNILYFSDVINDPCWFQAEDVQNCILLMEPILLTLRQHQYNWDTDVVDLFKLQHPPLYKKILKMKCMKTT
eukprot:477816_1